MHIYFFRRVHKIAKSDSELRHVCLSVSPPFRTEQIDSHWTDFHDFSFLSIYGKRFEKIQVSLKSDKNNGEFT